MEHPEYAFIYDIKDLSTGNAKSQWESRKGHATRGHYNILEPDGFIRSAHYTADAKHEFNAIVKTLGASSSYDRIMESKDLSQPKKNPYNKNQKYIALFTDTQSIKKPIGVLFHKQGKTSNVVEYKSHARITQIPMEMVQKSSESNPKTKYFKTYNVETTPDKQPINLSVADNDWHAIILDDTYYQPEQYYQSYYEKRKNSDNQPESIELLQNSIIKHSSRFNHHVPPLHTKIIPSKPTGLQRYIHNHSNNNNRLNRNFNAVSSSALSTINLSQYFKQRLQKPLKLSTHFDYSQYFQSNRMKPIKFKSKVTSKRPITFPERENDQVIASHRLMQSMIKHNVKHMAPIYANNYATFKAPLHKKH